MKKLFISVLAILAFLSACNKDDSLYNEPSESIPTNPTLITKTFSVTTPETKTSLDGLNVLWSEDDVISIIGINESGEATQHPFSIKSGQGTGSAVFSGEVGEDEVTFYAIYPNNKVSLKDGVLTSDNINPNQTAYEGTFDSSAAEMVAIADDVDNLAFTHGRAFFKFIMGSDDVTTVTFTSSNSKISAKSKYNMPDCTINGTGGEQDYSVTLTGTFIKGKTYFAAIAPHKNTLGTLSVQYSFSGGATATKKTTGLASVKPLEKVGRILNLGTIAMSPSPYIESTDVVIAASDNGGSINFAVGNLVSGGTVSYTVDSDGLSNTIWQPVSFDALTGQGSISFSCDSNELDSIREARVTITYSYSSTLTVEKEVEVSQAASSGGPVTHTYVFYINEDKNVVQTKDGDPGDYFTVTGSSILDCEANGYFTVDSFIINGTAYSHAKKIDGDNNVSFTTHSTATTTIRFWAAKRQENKDGIIKLAKGSSNVVNATMTLGQIYDSGVVTLDAGTEYKFSKSGEVGLFYIEVIETL